MSIASHRMTRPADVEVVTVRPFTPAQAIGARRSLRSWVKRVCTTGTSLDHLYGGFAADGRLIAAVLLVPQAGRTGLLFTAPPARSSDVNALAQVVTICCEQAPLGQVSLAQALLSPQEQREAQALVAAGFQKLATLAYMQAQVPARPTAPPTPAGVELHPFTPDLTDQVIAGLEASYRQTRDCPALRGLRETRDVLSGHRAVGIFDASLWTLVRVGGQPAGVLLLNRIPAAGCVELVYLGVAPEHRGRGLGTVLLQRALCQCAERGESHLTLAVDTDNAPAMALYRRRGFTRTATRSVFIRRLTGEQA